MIKQTVARGSLIRSEHGGYVRLVKDGVLQQTIYVKKNTVFRVNTINLYTQSVIAIEEATGRAMSLDYDYILENCVVLSHKQTPVLEGIAVVDMGEEQKGPCIYTKILIGLGILNVLLSVLFNCIKF